MKIGLVVALKTEAYPFSEAMKELKIPPVVYPASEGDFGVIEWVLPETQDNIYMVISGVGIIPAAAATQFLIDEFDVDKIINYGVVGGLKPDIPDCTVGYVKKVVKHDLDYRPFCSRYKYPGDDCHFEWSPYKDAFDVSGLGITEFICASGDRALLAGEPKKILQKETGADICDTESASIMWVTKKAKTPVLIIKAISDGVDEDEEAFQSNVRNASKRCVAVVKKVLGLPEPKKEEKEE